MPEQWRVEHLPPDLGPHAITAGELRKWVQDGINKHLEDFEP